VRYDPSTKKSVWFWDPELKEYFEIPCRNQAVYGYSHEEGDAIAERNRKMGDAMVDKRTIAEAKSRSVARTESAKAVTKSARRGVKGAPKGSPEESVIQTMTKPSAKESSAEAEENPFAKFAGKAISSFNVRVGGK
jgi:putative transposase